jgi:hypothetical protein
MFSAGVTLLMDEACFFAESGPSMIFPLLGVKEDKAN